METFVQIVTWILIIGGSLAVLTGGIGVLRMPDFYTRMHAAGITDTMGAGLILAGLMVHSGWSLITAKLFLMAVFLFFTSPTSSFALAHAALTSGVEPVLVEENENEDEDGADTKDGETSS